MLNSFIEGFLLGMGAAIPLGPINILIMNHALKNYKSAVACGFGAMSTDIMYLFLILFGLTSFVENPLIFKVLGLLGSLFLAYMTYGIFKSRKNTLVTKGAVVTAKGLIKNYLQGFFLTSVNPYTLVFWLSIAGYTVNQDLNSGMLLAGMFSSIILWITLMPYFVHKSKHKISAKVSYSISIVSTLLLGFFAFSLLLNVLREW
ncbi:MAG: Lysine transporter LysE [uncultured Sulfurovum sp.]|uniref:Lysine transporter LysE n=1 Tax=uncultured Sulfurovum sp. TaxID=269237 RepID=A0A6S6U7C6_9BACT|nr:MAG: Lysine transporter LysE [uncultured Sulfurovum sp.]